MPEYIKDAGKYALVEFILDAMKIKRCWVIM